MGRPFRSVYPTRRAKPATLPHPAERRGTAFGHEDLGELLKRERSREVAEREFRVMAGREPDDEDPGPPLL